ncbi:Alpha/Beta hydrolase protein [Blyttiomyces helicus]|uniref:Alpha/Beta hydrolase protein n=1 Tax=Blyttiomyces helicus TaxID=388810 RepID=A0A4P9WB38_9FUNG|nr:Alpha/Beta hydrolase protein [Blyttiomyces helicus]|eukprot:RKO88753.1 Alpha/Beta hydrolase protein [Blyttiomyces helicus]
MYLSSHLPHLISPTSHSLAFDTTNRGYGCESHTVHTTDGHALEIHRMIPNPSPPNPRRAVIVFHGLAISSEVWLCNPTSATSNFAPALLAAGFDVFLANTRGNKYSDLGAGKPRAAAGYWAFGIDEMAAFDVPAVVHHVRAVTGRETVSCVGYSQGSTMLFAALAMQEGLNDVVDCCVMMAPVIKPKGMSLSVVGNVISSTTPSIIYGFLGTRSLLPCTDFVKNHFGPHVFARVVHRSFEALFGWKCTSWPEEHRVALYGHVFGGTSVQCVVVSWMLG